MQLVFAVFDQAFIFHQMIALEELSKTFFISPKKLFSFSRYSSFCILVFLSFSPCQPLLQTIIQEKSYDVINCLNKNLITHFVWYLEKEITVTLFFLSNPVPFNGQSYQKQKGSGASDQSLFRLRNKFIKIPLFVIYHLTKIDDLMWSSFWVIPKITFAKLCKPIHDIMNFSTSICPFESGRFGKEGKKLQKFESFEKEIRILDKIKNIFHSF